jgi:hypothetical protein
MPSGSDWQEKTLWSFAGTWQDGYGVSPVGGLILDGSGNLCGTTQSLDNGPGGGTVFELTPFNGSWTMAHVSGLSSGLNGSGPVDSLAMEAAGNLYGTEVSVEDSAGIFKVLNNWTVTYLYTWSQEGAYAYGGPILDANGNLYGTNAGAGPNHDGVVWEITP